ncbi:hypothetical protein E8F12_17735 [Pseudomonas sp. BN102]|nr:hypothetical protein [Pseudomonas sp. BN102]
MALQVVASLAAGYLSATYFKQPDATHNLILGAMVAAAIYWALTLKVARQLILWGMTLAVFYHLYQAWLHY